MKYLITITLLCSALAAQVPLDDSDRKGMVEIVVVDSNGVPVRGNISFSVRQIQGGKNTPEVTVGAKASLNYGTYNLTVRGSPAYPVDKIIKVRDPYQVVLVGLFVAPIELPWVGNIVRGKLPPTSKEGGCSWVRLVSPVSENEFADAKALASGEFVLENVKPGKYLLVTFGDRGICDVVQATVVDKPNQEIMTGAESTRRT